MVMAKKKIMESLEKLLLYQDLDDIYVTDIIREANVSRKTFYRHFQDKYDLVNSYFSEFYRNSFELIVLGKDWNEALLSYLTICEEKSIILCHAYSSRDANGLRKYDIEMTIKTYEKYLLMKDVDIKQKEIRFAIEISSYGGTEMIIQWLLTGMKEKKTILVNLIKRTLPQDIIRYLN